MSAPAVSYAPRATVASLRRQGALAALAGLVALGAVGVTEPLFLALALPVWAASVAVLFRWLEENRAGVTGALEPSLGWPTAVTLVRGALIAFLAGSVVLSPAMGAAAYSIAAILDRVDGLLARRLERATRLGAEFDMEIDALGILVATSAGIFHGKLPLAYLVVGLARYLFVAGLWLRRRRGVRTRELDPSSLRRLLAGFQMGFLAVALWPVVPPGLTRSAAIVFGGAALLMFWRDWRYATRAAA